MISRTKVLTLIVFGLIFLNLSAQDGFEGDKVAKLPDEDRTFRFGLHFSPNLSWFKTNTNGYSSDGTKMGFSYGLSFEYFLSNNYLISSGLNVLNTGGKLKFKSATIINTSTQPLEVFPTDALGKYSMKYIEIPLTLKMRSNEIGYLTYYGQFGFKVAINFKSRVDYTSSYYDSSIDSTITNQGSVDDASESFNFMNLSLVVGGGVEYNVSGNMTLNFGLTFNNGFINQSDMKSAVYDASGQVVVDSEGFPVKSEKDVNANLNYLALNVGIYF